MKLKKGDKVYFVYNGHRYKGTIKGINSKECYIVVNQNYKIYKYAEIIKSLDEVHRDVVETMRYAKETSKI